MRVTNPLVGASLKDTIENVAAVLEFVSVSIPVMEREQQFSAENAHGIFLTTQIAIRALETESKRLTSRDFR